MPAQVVQSGDMFLIRYAPGEFMPLHAHSYSKISVILAGSVLEERGGQQFGAEAGNIVVKPSGVEHTDTVGPEGLTTLSFIPRPNSAAAQEVWEDLSGSYTWLELDPVVSRLTRAWLEEQIVEDELVDEVLFSVAASSPLARKSDSRHDMWCREAIRLLNEDLAYAPMLGELAERMCMHPVSLAKALRERTGLSKTELVQRLRIKAALPQLTGERHLGEIAHELGFADQAHFCRVFRRWMGCSPRQFVSNFLING